MNLYDKHILPKLVNFACRQKPNMAQRQKIVPLAKGTVLEVGVGSGLNLGFYEPDRVDRVFGLDPSLEMWAIARRKLNGVPVKLSFLNTSAEQIPLDRASVDTVVVTYTLCTIPDAVAALREMKRVLRPGGEILFCEHGAAPDASVRKWQDRLNPYWGKISGGCNLNRNIPELLREAGLSVREQETMYLPGWRPASFNYWGVAS